MKPYRTILLVAGLIVLTSCDGLFAPEPASEPEAIFEYLWTTFNEEYATFSERGVDWNALFHEYRPRVTPATTDAELYAVLTSMLAHLDDSHVGLTAPHQHYFNANRIYRERIDRELFDLNIIRENYLDSGMRVDHGYVYGRIKGEEIGYIYFGTVNSATMSRLPAMLDAYPDVAGYIVDLRRNNGGNHAFAFQNMGRFTDQERFVFRSKTKNGPGPDDFTAWHDWHLKPSGRYVDRPIVVLTDRYTPSAAERMVMAFKTLPNATMVGETTNGTLGTKIGRELANGWFFTLTVQKVEMYDGTSYDGIGLLPDIAVKNEANEVQAGIDRTLERAVDYLQTGL